MSLYAPWVSPFLEHLRQSANMSASARAVGVPYGTVMGLRKSDADFAAAVDEALEQAFDVMEHEMRRRAFEGVEEPVVYQGQLTPIFERDANGQIVMEAYDTGMRGDNGEPVMGTRPRLKLDANGQPQFLSVRKYSDSLAMFLMKGYRRRTFGDKTEITGKDGGPLQVMDETKKASRIAALLDLAKRRKQFDDLA